MALKLSWRVVRRINVITNIEEKIRDLLIAHDIGVIASESSGCPEPDNVLQQIRGFTGDSEQIIHLSLEERLLNVDLLELRRPVRFFWSIQDFIMGVRAVKAPPHSGRRCTETTTPNHGCHPSSKVAHSDVQRSHLIAYSRRDRIGHVLSGDPSPFKRPRHRSESRVPSSLSENRRSLQTLQSPLLSVLSVVFRSCALRPSSASYTTMPVICDVLILLPGHSIYGETISGVVILRAFSTSSKFLRHMIRCVDTNANPYYWMWGVNRWFSTRFSPLSSAVISLTGLMFSSSPNICAALIGFTLAFASNVTHSARRFVGLEQSMVRIEYLLPLDMSNFWSRLPSSPVKEHSERTRKSPEFIEPSPAQTWPDNGSIDPTILSGTVRSMLDVFDEYQNAEIVYACFWNSPIFYFINHSRPDTLQFKSLRRVHLVLAEATPSNEADTVNVNVSRNLDPLVSEGRENFSTGECPMLDLGRD
ncbi:hypothetical protein BJ138DRAFT_1119284 [Hygrophoropsis aurantiaca]|uniref:Uncharacterized protein n=1 Tax=Hygrophoropsis aurantiaca TaxID=72124 RepID=A0ACB7ZUF6_9AGAM|nr:hypothetical protein BJ138DRAFT_1119284 [Hygrophoropsis aurantiaca]